MVILHAVSLHMQMNRTDVFLLTNNDVVKYAKYQSVWFQRNTFQEQCVAGHVLLFNR